MQPHKTLLDPKHVRAIPKTGFSWIDRRLVREGWLELVSQEELLLYLFLAIVGDARGLSFYADPTIVRLLKLSHEDLFRARAGLVERKLIAYKYPLYQVLEIPPRTPVLPADAKRPRGRGESEPMLLGEFFNELARRSMKP